MMQSKTGQSRRFLTIIKPMIEEDTKVSFRRMWDAITHSEELPGDLGQFLAVRSIPHFGEKISMNTFFAHTDRKVSCGKDERRW